MGIILFKQWYNQQQELRAIRHIIVKDTLAGRGEENEPNPFKFTIHYHKWNSLIVKHIRYFQQCDWVRGWVLVLGGWHGAEFWMAEYWEWDKTIDEEMENFFLINQENISKILFYF